MIGKGWYPVKKEPGRGKENYFIIKILRKIVLNSNSVGVNGPRYLK